MHNFRVNGDVSVIIIAKLDESTQSFLHITGVMSVSHTALSTLALTASIFIIFICLLLSPVNGATPTDMPTLCII